MATQLDLQEQEQLDQLKAFWKEYGNLITWVIALVLLAFAGWNYWNKYQRDQVANAAAMYDEMDRAAQAQDPARAAAVFNDLKQRYPRTAYAAQAGLMAAKVAYDKGQADPAKAALSWVADNAKEDEFRDIARLRLAGVLLDQKQYADALKALEAVKAPEFTALVADRRGDALLAQGKRDEAKAAYQAAWKAMDSKTEYRSLIEAKLTELGAAPAPDAAASAVSAGARS